MVMVDERTGEKYARAAGHKGMGKDQDMEWLIKDMSNELNTCSTRCSGEVPWRHSRTRRASCRCKPIEWTCRRSGENGQGVCVGIEGAGRGEDERDAAVR